jgi:hypothetical protein
MMSIPIQNVSAGAINPQQQGKKSAPEVLQGLQDVIDIMQGFGDEFAGTVKAQNPNKEVGQQSTSRLHSQKGKPELNLAGLEALAAEAAGVEDDTSIKKKKRKNQEALLKKLMAKLAELENAYDLDQLDEEDREIVNSFLKNMGDIKKLKKELTFLIQQEEQYQHLIDVNQKGNPKSDPKSDPKSTPKSNL